MSLPPGTSMAVKVTSAGRSAPSPHPKHRRRTLSTIPVIKPLLNILQNEKERYPIVDGSRIVVRQLQQSASYRQYNRGPAKQQEQFYAYPPGLRTRRRGR